MPLPIFLFAGQSNMAGGAKTADLPAEVLDAVAGVRMYEKDAWRSPGWWTTFGPEVGFAREMLAQRPDMPFAICKVAFGGANLYYDWNPDGRSQGPEDAYRGPMYPRLIDAWQRVRDETGGTAAALVWMQGERDSVFDFMANAYLDNLRNFITCVRRDVGRADLPFLIGEISPRVLDLQTLQYKHAFRKQVQATQRAFAAEDPFTEFIETQDLPQFDNLHFDAAGQLLLGRRYAQAYLENK